MVPETSDRQRKTDIEVCCTKGVQCDCTRDVGTCRRKDIKMRCLEHKDPSKDFTKSERRSRAWLVEWPPSGA